MRGHQQGVVAPHRGFNNFSRPWLPEDLPTMSVRVACGEMISASTPVAADPDVLDAEERVAVYNATVECLNFKFEDTPNASGTL